MDSTKATHSEHSAVYDEALLAELTQRVGSVEKAKEVYALFSATLMKPTTAAPSQTIPEDSAAQPAVSQEEEPQDSARAPDSGSRQTETVSREADEVEAADGLPTGDGRDESDATAVLGEQGGRNPSSWGEEGVEGETPVLDSTLEGETLDVLEYFEGDAPVETGNETPVDFRGEAPEPEEEGATPSNVGSDTPVYIEGATPMEEDVGGTPGNFEKEADLETAEVSEPGEEGLHLIVDLVGYQEEAEPKVDERAARRRARRSLLR